MEVASDIGNGLPEFHRKVLIYTPGMAEHNPLLAYRRPCCNGQWIWDLTDGTGLLPNRVTYWKPASVHQSAPQYARSDQTPQDAHVACAGWPNNEDMASPQGF